MEKIISLLQPNQAYTQITQIRGKDIAMLNRRATAYKDQGNWASALACLYRAREVALNRGIPQTIAQLLRLPLFLQQAGFFGAAKYELQYLLENMAEFIALETKGLNFMELQTAFHKEIYLEAICNKAALIFKREKDKETAVLFKIMEAEHKEKRISACEKLKAARQVKQSY